MDLIIITVKSEIKVATCVIFSQLLVRLIYESSLQTRGAYVEQILKFDSELHHFD